MVWDPKDPWDKKPDPLEDALKQAQSQLKDLFPSGGLKNLLPSGGVWNLVIAAVFILFGWQSVFIVAPDEEGVVKRFGVPVRTVEPGPHFKIPFAETVLQPKVWGADLHLSADGRWLYTSERNSHTLAGFAIDAVTGLLAPIDHWSTQLQPRGFAITPDGRHLIAAGQISHRVGVHLIAPGSGALTQVAEHDVGLNPNWITVLPMQPDA